MLSEKIRTFRKGNKWTQQELARRLHVGQTTIANYETGLREPDLEKLLALAELYNVSLDELTGREFAPTTAEPLTFDQYFTSLLEGDRRAGQQHIQALLDSELDTIELLRDYPVAALLQTGALWQQGQLAVWQEHMISELILDQLSRITRGRQTAVATARTVITLVPGAEAHSLALRMIGCLLEEAGPKVIHLGSLLPAGQLVQAVKTLKADVLVLSITMPEHLDAAALSIERLKQELKQKSPRIIVGGSAFTLVDDPCREVGADVYTETFEAVVEAVGRT